MGGAERSVQLLAEAMQRAGHEVIVVRAGRRNQCYVHRGVRVIALRVENFSWPFGGGQRPLALRVLWHLVEAANPAMARALAELCARERPQLVHTHTLLGLSAAVWPVARRAGAALVHTLRDYYLACPRFVMFRHGRNCERVCWPCRPVAAVRRGLAAALDAVVGISEAVLERHRALGYFRQVPLARVIPNPYPLPSEAAARRAPAPAGAPLRLGYLGRLHPAKGVELLLQELRGASQLPPWQLVVAGRGRPGYEARLRARAAGDARVRFAGAQAPERVLAELDALVVPSLWHEPLGRVVIEALAHGVPVIGARRGGIPELLEPGRTGWLFEPQTPGALAACVHELAAARSRLAEMAAACRRAARRFEPARIAAEHLALYEELLRGRKAAGS
ncbi:MAG: glycosyl transferase [Planctomycetota bacterium]|nr:MAG: glycosyl transferase [Planctomycetota bacterium]